MNGWSTTVRALEMACVWAALSAVEVPALVSAGVAPGNDTSADAVLVPGNQSVPQLVFAADRPTTELASLLADPDVIPELRQLNAGIALALPDLSEARAHIVEALNQAQIPVTAWLALPVSKGYYFNAGNESDAAERFREFERWTAQYHLRWAAVGVDIEPNIQEFAELRSHKLRLAMLLVRRYFDLRRVKDARRSYAALVRQIQSAGYLVETYQFPFIADERKQHSSILERLGGVVDVRGDREVLMLYSSFNPRLDSALIWVYGSEAQIIAVGSTMGSESDRGFRPLDWEAFSRDLLVAHHFSHLLGVYSLEGCIRQGFLPKLVGFDWGQATMIPGGAVYDAARLRRRIQMGIWIATNLPWITVVMFTLVAIMLWRWRTRRPRHTNC